MQIKVANLRNPEVKAAIKAVTLGVRYCGRADRWGRWAGSKFANPFVIGKDGTRDEVIERFRMWIWSQPDLIAELVSMAEMGIDWVLVCWCAPESCHCDVLKEIMEGANTP